MSSWVSRPGSSTSSDVCSGKRQTKHRTPGWVSWDYNFDMDHYLNPFLPSGPRILRKLPRPVRRFLGHRDKMKTESDSDLVVWLWAFVGAFTGVAVVEAVFMHWRFMVENGVPIIVGSYGAAAVLLYNTVDSPLAQPRNAFGGQVLSAIVGVVVTKLFMLSPNFHEFIWLAGALSCALASVLMGVTKTVHPPAGATALLAAVDGRVREMGWLLVPVVIVSSGLMIGVALVMGNLQRTYPRYWWTAEMVGGDLRKARKNSKQDVEKVVEKGDEAVGNVSFADTVVIERDKIMIPEFIVLGDIERNVLEVLRGRIQEYHDDMEAERIGRIRVSMSENTLQ